MNFDPILNLAQVVPCTEAEGPGRRFAVWFQGCPLRCPGCCNPEFLPFPGGTPTRLSELVRRIEAVDVEGITLLGGEPFAHAEGATALAAAARTRGLGVMVFTGYTIEELRANPDPAVATLLAETDLLVDGPYLREHPETTRRWIGSANQRLHFLTDRYRPDDPCWRMPNTLELRVRGSEVTVNGFPATSSKGLWKGWRRSAAGASS
jgi:anaerobic ribonucleoside-triphosphate reductase activating protein